MTQNPPFATIGDEPIEARIVAWVLGDASAFEAAELERLCGERPELLVFRRRMRALHSLLIEAETATPDRFIKLPPAKRQALDEILGAEEPVNVLDHPRAARSSRHSWRQRLLAIAACLILLVGIAAVCVPAFTFVNKVPAVASAKPQAANAPDSAAAILDHKKVIRNQENAAVVRDQSLAMNDRDASRRQGVSGKTDSGTLVPLETDCPIEQMEETSGPPIVLNSPAPAAAPKPVTAAPGVLSETARLDNLAKNAAPSAAPAVASYKRLDKQDQRPKDAEVAKAEKGKDVAIAEVNGYVGDTTVTRRVIESDALQRNKKSAAGEKPAISAGLVQSNQSRLESALADSDRYVVEAREARAKHNYQQAYDNYAKGLALLPDVPATSERRGILRKSLGELALALANAAMVDGKNDAAKAWLGKAVEWDPHNEAARQKN